MTTGKEKSITLLHPIRSVRRTLFSIVMGFIGITVFLGATPWQQTAITHGRVIAYSATERQQTLTAMVEGRVAKWYVQEGQNVKKGDKIVDVLDNDPNIIQNLTMEKRALQSRLLATQKATEISRLNIQRQKMLFDRGISSRRTYEQSQIEVAKLESDTANIQAEISRIQVRLARQDSQFIISPIDGMILRRMTGEAGAYVKVGDILAELVPQTQSRSVELWVDGNDIPLIHIGEHARLQFEGWPAIQFSGWPSVAVGTFGGTVRVVDTADNGKGQFRVLVTPDRDDEWPEPRYLRQGVRVHGWILLSQVPLWYELWRQLNGFPPSQEEEPKK